MKKQSPTTTIGELSNDPKVAVEQIVGAFQAGIDEAKVIGSTAKWMVCFANDLTPFRTDGREIRMTGGAMWMATSQTEAMQVAKTLDAKANVGEHAQRVVAMECSEWATKRIPNLERMIRTVRENFAKQA